MNLSTLEQRLKYSLPEKEHETVEREFSRFEMEASRLSNEPDKIGQATLTESEIRKATTTNQHGDYGHTVIELQAIKAAAIEYGVNDWLSYVDPEITYGENIDIMREEGKATNKEVHAKAKEYQRWK